MVAVKAAQSSAFLQAIPDSCSVILVFGTDVGLVSERAAAAAKAFAGREQPPGEVIRIEDADLEQDPDRLIVELQTIPMFGGGKVVRTTIGRRVTGAVVKSIVEDGPPAAQMVIEAGNLKPSDAARKAIEAVPWAAAIACYADGSRDLNSLVNEMISEAGLSISSQAKEALLERLGADRALSRGEIEKLILFVGDKREVALEDVETIVGDSSEMAMDIVIDAAALGQSDTAVREFDRLIAAGDSPQVLIGAVQRHFRRLHRLRSAMDSGKSFDDAARGLRPPLFFKQKDAVAAQCRTWSGPRLITALQRIGETARAARRNATMDLVLAERLLLDLAVAAKSQRRR